jgi:polyphosphate kinase
MSEIARIRFDVPDGSRFESLLNHRLPEGFKEAGRRSSFHRDEYYDTPDRVLQTRGIRCRVRHRSDDRCVVTLWTPRSGNRKSNRDHRCDASVDGPDAKQALSGGSEPARRLRAVTDPSRLERIIEIETQRQVRTAQVGSIPWRRIEIVLDQVTVRSRELHDTFWEVKIRPRGYDGPRLEELSISLQTHFQLRTVVLGKRERAEKRIEALESDELAHRIRGSREVTFLALAGHRVAVLHDGSSMFLPIASGSGEEVCRHLVREHLGTSRVRLSLIGSSSGGGRPLLEVWMVRDLPAKRIVDNEAVRWIGIDDVMARVGSPVLRDPRTLSALAVAARSDLFPPRSSGGEAVQDLHTEAEYQTLSDLQVPVLPETSLDAAQPVPDQFVNEQLSWIEFNTRVLELAEDPGTPLLARVLFLSIFSSNLDEFFMIRVGTLKHAVVDGLSDLSPDGLTPQEELDAISIRLSPLIHRQHRVFHDVLLRQLNEHGIQIKPWSELDDAEREVATRYFDRQVFPAVTPQAMTQAPGHPFPHLPNLSLSLAVSLRDGNGPLHFAHVRVPSGLPRFVRLGEGTVFIPIEQLIAANLHSVYPNRTIESAHAFRLTRSGDIRIDEDAAASLLRAVEEEVKRRPFGAVVRIEVDARMPAVVRDLLRRELAFEDSAHAAQVTEADFVQIDGLVDLASLDELAALPIPSLRYADLVSRDPFPPDRSIFDVLAQRDVLVHHPYDSFRGSVQRFIEEAAEDPDVVSIKMTLYRSGRESVMVGALLRAAASGKDVSVFVELKARFDEERNIQWAKRLEHAGIHVVTGFVKLKTHAKVALVVRRLQDTVRRYVHIGTGNYNEVTAHVYTDLGLFSSNERLGADLNDLFNEFTGSSGPPMASFRELLVAPKHMLPRFLDLINSETEQAKAGEGGRIRVKLNGLADLEIIAALYRASQAGVEVDLIIRGICALRPGVPGLSERIRVFSILGRFLEHARIYHFANGGTPLYFLGSADWRPRNLRRRVEVVAPVHDLTAQSRLNEILEGELDDPYAWQMRSDGRYERQPPQVGVDRIAFQERLVAATRDARQRD